MLFISILPASLALFAGDVAGESDRGNKKGGGGGGGGNPKVPNRGGGGGKGRELRDLMFKGGGGGGGGGRRELDCTFEATKLLLSIFLASSYIC